MVMLVFLSQGLILGGTAAAQPGPLQAYLLSQTLKNGWRRTLPAAFAPLISDIPIVLLIIFVLTRAPSWSLTFLQIIGGFFLIYLAFSSFRNLKSSETLQSTSVESSKQSILKASLMNFFSPNPYIFWATIAGPIFIEGWRQAPQNGISFVLGFYIMLIGGFAAFVALFALTKHLDSRVNRILGRLSAAALLIFGLYQLWQGFSAL